MRLAGLLRLTAMAIALLAWLDPPVVVAQLPPVAADVVLVRSALDETPAVNVGGSTLGERISEIGASIARQLAQNGDVRLHEMRDPLHLPCDAVRPCIVVAGPLPSVHVPFDRSGPISVVTVGETLEPNLAVQALQASATHTAAEGAARVTLRGLGMEGQRTRVRLFDAGAMVGEASHTWAADREAIVDLAWWPFAPGTRALSVEATAENGGERTAIDNHAEAVVQVADAQWPVTVHEARPSWGTTFVRRALEGDPRITLEARTDVAPQISAVAGSRPPVLDDARLDRARVVVVGAPESLSSQDVTRLEHFIRRRGGSVVLVPDRPFAGPVLRLIGQRWSEHLTDTPAQAGSLHASEWLIASDLSAFDEVVAASDRGPAVVLTPMGAGRVMVVGAMDAWRRRGGGDEAYARFWRVAVARLAEEAGPAVAVSVEPTWARPGQDVSVRVSARSTAVVTTWLATATLACDDSAGLPLRLWPANAAGEFEARARLDGSTASCTVTARVEGLGEGTAHILVTPRAPEPASSPELLDRAIARTGGLALRESDVPRLVDASRAGGSTDRVPDTRYPMRSSWWMLPLVTCLAGEWWLRRRNGLR